MSKTIKTRHFGSHNMGKLRGLRHKGRIIVRYSPVNLGGRDSTKMCVQYDFTFTSVNSEIGMNMIEKESYIF